MKSEALQYLESRLSIGHINIQEFTALHALLASFNRTLKLLKRTFAGDIDRRSGRTLIAEEASHARRHLDSFYRLYSHTAVECKTTSEQTLDPTNPRDKQKANQTRVDFKNDIERLPGTKLLFELISENFDDNIYHPFLEAHRRHPRHPIWELNTELTAVYVALIELYDLVSTAEECARQINKQLADFRRACDEHAEGLALKQGNETSTELFKLTSSFPQPTRTAGVMCSRNIQKKTSYDTPSHPYGVGRSFGAVEEAVHRRPGATKADCTAEEGATASPQISTIARRIEHVVPRIFTGSFSELEESMRKLRIPQGEASPVPQTATTDPNAILEFVTTPASCATPLSNAPHSPGQLLRRREALIEREVEFQDRMINGGIIRSRRPIEDGENAGTARIRAEEPLFKNETLSRWLNEPPQHERKVLCSTSRAQREL